MALTIYRKTICSNCSQIEAILKARKIAFNEINIDEDTDAFQYVVDRGIKQAPFLQLTNEAGEEIDSASGKAIMEVMGWHKQGLI